MMNDTDFVLVSKETAEEVLNRKDVYPTFLERNDDNSFTATFERHPAPIMQGKIKDADDAIRIVEPEIVEAREPNVEPSMAVTVSFGFIESPLEH